MFVSGKGDPRNERRRVKPFVIVKAVALCPSANRERAGMNRGCAGSSGGATCLEQYSNEHTDMECADWSALLRLYRKPRLVGALHTGRHLAIAYTQLKTAL